MEPVINDENDLADGNGTDQGGDATDTDRTDGEESVNTPSQSRSSSVHPVAGDEESETVDVFDGYSFKGRHSVIMDDEEEEEEEDEEDEQAEDEMDEEAEGALNELNGQMSIENGIVEEERAEAQEERTPEPKTPEAKKTDLPETPTETTQPELETPTSEVPPAIPPKTPVKEALRRSGEQLSVATAPSTPPKKPATTKPEVAATTAAAATSANPAEVHRKEPKTVVAPSKQSTKPKTIKDALHGRPPRSRREKSGIPALDRYLPDAFEEDEAATERDEDEEDDWDFIEADGGAEERNGPKGTSLFARGVVDRYKLSVFRKGSTPNRSVSGMSNMSEISGYTASTPGSPSPSEKKQAEKERRGEDAGVELQEEYETVLEAEVTTFVEIVQVERDIYADFVQVERDVHADYDYDHTDS